MDNHPNIDATKRMVSVKPATMKATRSWPDSPEEAKDDKN